LEAKFNGALDSKIKKEFTYPYYYYHNSNKYFGGLMPNDHTPPHPPRHHNASSLKFHVADAEALNSAERVALTAKNRSITPAEGHKALEIGHAMNEGTLPEMSMTRLFTGPKP
jgi:hypothetical protein